MADNRRITVRSGTLAGEACRHGSDGLPHVLLGIVRAGCCARAPALIGVKNPAQLQRIIHSLAESRLASRPDGNDSAPAVTRSTRNG